jgi:hypothetical protein
MHKIKIALLGLFILSGGVSKAISWNEPWAADVIKEAESFILARIDSFDSKKGISVEIIKSLGGVEITGKIKITNFYHLDLCSMSSGDYPYFHFRGVKKCYFFLKKNKKGEYCIATPTAGFDRIQDSNVIATYRHSYHQAMVPIDVYEKTMTAIFNNYHGMPYDTKYINSFVNKYLSLPPTGKDESAMKIFFLQHVALECIYHLRLEGFYSKIIPFLNDMANFHDQVSATRALVAYNTIECKTILLNIISDTARGCFVKVACIWTLKEFKPVELKDQLVKLSSTASSGECGFGGDIMDDRICTHFPDVRAAIDDLITQIK